MKMWHLFVAAAVVAAAAYRLRPPGAPPAPSATPRAVTAAIEAPPAPRAAVFAAAEPGPHRPVIAPPPPSLEGEPAADPAAVEPTRPPLDAPALRAYLGDRFERERDDAAWSGAARAAVERTFAGLMPPRSVLKSVACKATMCRLELAYTDLAQYQAFLHQLTPAALPWNGTLFASAVGDAAVGPPTIVAFLSREGEPLLVDEP